MNLDLMKAELRADEGERLKPYKDTVGKLTIGVGRNLDDVGISEEESGYLLGNDIDRTMMALDNALPWWRQLDEVRQRVVVNMAFNMGVRGLLLFKQTLAAMQSGDYSHAADQMLNSTWATQVGLRASRLSKMMREG